MMWGMRDWCFRPECLRQLQRHFPNAQTIEFADAGHYLMEDAPREVVAALATFLAAAPSPEATGKP
jgi:haloalkane dehalogenase